MSGEPTTHDTRPREGRKPLALVVAPNRQLTFVQDDLRILATWYELDVVTRRSYPSRRRLLPAILRRFLRRRYALLYIWFLEPNDSPYLVWLARLFRIPCVVVPGGYDLAWLPRLNYGALATRLDRCQVKAALLGADAVLPTSRLLENEVHQLGRTRGVRVIYPGLDCNYFTPGTCRKERLVVTVATIGPITAPVKGLDVFVRCAQLLPDVQFVILGPCTDPRTQADLQAAGGQNLTIVGRRLSRRQLRSWYQRASVYAQLSARESFGVALAEAMACACAPVVANTGSLPEVVGNAGYVVEYGDAEATARAITEALHGDRGSQARARVQAHYGIERRQHALRESLAAVAAGGC